MVGSYGCAMGYEIDHGSVINYFAADFSFVLRAQQVIGLCLLKKAYQKVYDYRSKASGCECRG